MNELYVRVKPKIGAEQFHRCAMLFTLAWSLVTVDDATAQRLREEQMLEVSSDTPADDVSPADSVGQGETADEPDTVASAPDTHVEPETTPGDPVSATGEGTESDIPLDAPELVAQASSLPEADGAAQVEAVKPTKAKK